MATRRDTANKASVITRVWKFSWSTQFRKGPVKFFHFGSQKQQDLFPTLGVGLLDCKLNSSPRPPSPQSVPGVPRLKVVWSAECPAPESPCSAQPRVSLECPTPSAQPQSVLGVPQRLPQLPNPRVSLKEVPSPTISLKCPTSGRLVPPRMPGVPAQCFWSAYLPRVSLPKEGGDVRSKWLKYGSRLRLRFGRESCFAGTSLGGQPQFSPLLSHSVRA